jgi:hypothetical protein
MKVEAFVDMIAGSERQRPSNGFRRRRQKLKAKAHQDRLEAAASRRKKGRRVVVAYI